VYVENENVDGTSGIAWEKEVPGYDAAIPPQVWR
jgi:hypothetical protein